MHTKGILFIYGNLAFINKFLQSDSIKDVIIRCINNGITIRCLTRITKKNLRLYKEVSDIIGGKNLKHVNRINGNFVMNDTECLVTPSFYLSQNTPQLLYSNSEDIVKQYRQSFETLWTKSINGEVKMKDIENDNTQEIMEVLRNSNKIKKIYQKIVNNSVKEVMIIFPSINAFLRQYKIGIINSLKKVVEENGVKVRILMPLENNTHMVMPYLKEIYNQETIQKDRNNAIPNILSLEIGNNIDIRHIERMSETKATIVIVDKDTSLVMELKDDSQNTFEKAIGWAIYSNSKPTVLSYLTVFESFWNNSFIFKQLKEHDIVQKEFISVAAHELRTPIQALVGYAELIQGEQNEQSISIYIKAIHRNAERLNKLVNDILDVSRIERNKLSLSLRQFDLSVLMRDITEDFRNQFLLNKPNAKDIHESIKLIENIENNVVITADKDRIMQVISNILYNAFQFTKEGSILIKLQKIDTTAIIEITDTGVGIESTILPKLFTKFSTNTYTGTGLGLYISKKIIEAHGGKIWAQNSPQGHGAVFSFSLPIN